jgi:hypothetical protein
MGCPLPPCFSSTILKPDDEEGEYEEDGEAKFSEDEDEPVCSKSKTVKPRAPSGPETTTRPPELG